MIMRVLAEEKQEFDLSRWLDEHPENDGFDYYEDEGDGYA